MINNVSSQPSLNPCQCWKYRSHLRSLSLILHPGFLTGTIQGCVRLQGCLLRITGKIMLSHWNHATERDSHCNLESVPFFFCLLKKLYTDHTQHFSQPNHFPIYPIFLLLWQEKYVCVSVCVYTYIANWVNKILKRALFFFFTYCASKEFVHKCSWIFLFFM